jgi:chaperone required for assembly of F1-ATPase
MVAQATVPARADRTDDRVKRFWKTAAAVPADGRWAIVLDGKQVHTPGRKPLIVATQRLAEAIAEEWTAVGETIDPRSMPLTGLANAAVERVAPDVEAFASSLAKYAESDLTCYRAEHPGLLMRRQEESWDPLLAWARGRYDVDFETTAGIVHVEQLDATVRRLSAEVAALDPFRLAGLSPLVTIGGSLIAALAILEEALPAEEMWRAVSVDERWQAEQWGADAEAEAALDRRRHDFLAAARFLEFLD